MIVMRRCFAYATGFCLMTMPLAHAQEVTLRASGTYVAGHTASVAMETFKSELSRLTNGAVRVDFFPGSQLGGNVEQVDQVRTGQIPIALGAPNFFSSLLPELDAATLPFAVSNSRQAACLIDGPLGKFLNRKMEEKGIVVLGWGFNGLRNVTNNVRPIRTVADMKGLKIRVPGSDAFLRTFRALGANPTAVDIKELYSALQQGVVDGQENPYGNMVALKIFEVQKQLSNTGHFFDWAFYVMHKATYDSLKPEYQKAIRTAMDTAVAGQRAAADKDNAAGLAELTKRGMQYTEIPAAELAKFREATRPVYADVRKRLGDGVMDIAMKGIEACQ
jgi:tripartite ATP-independent transporter DctP family solute receptor